MPTRAIPLLPNYEYLERIGRGAGAAISLARGPGGKLVAIKHIVRHGPEDDRFITQAETEYDVARRMDHPSLRQCYELIRVRKWLKTRELFLIMEYVDGLPLELEAPRDNLLAMVGIFRRSAEGLLAMHEAGYAHADIKPNNILLVRGGGLKLIDYGQSCPLGHTKQRIQGTPDYMAPEQVLRKAIDERTDVFNLGATMYWLTTGKWFKTIMPAANAGARKIAIESARGNDPPHELNPAIPLPLSKLITECCEHEKEPRPRDMKIVLSRLEIILHLLRKNDGKRRRPTRGQPTPIPESDAESDDE